MSLTACNPFGDEMVLRSVDWLENFPWRQENGLNINRDKYEINVNVKGFHPEEITIKVVNGFIVVEAYHEEKRDEYGYISKKIVRRFLLPDDCEQEKVESRMTADNILIIRAPREIVKHETVIPVKHEISMKSKL
ncbi:unnamed protein product [Diatraea saccharalis]|uniref:SHSP domain-containing protein n=1 Tax=Diatraea saccharalis TaxID=40085 RepID=A0A9N9RG54_9NEOP|nr:unnamed protein product [Diatraea saccharalis]